MAKSKINYLADELKLWWNPEINETERHEKINAVVNHIKQKQRYVDDDNLRHLKMYIKREYSQDENGEITAAGSNPRIGINAVKSAIDTICARITQQEPHPQLKTEGGRWDQRLKARKLEKFVGGVFYEEEFYPKSRRMFKDGAIFGTGYMKPFFVAGRVRWERIVPTEIVVDEEAAMRSTPCSFFQVRSLPVEQVIAMFPEKQVDILGSRMSFKTYGGGVSSAHIRVIEAWYIPPDDKTTSRHTICTDGVTLMDEEWTYDCDPLLIFRWNELPVGFFGNGAAEDLEGLQEEIDFIMQRIQISTHNTATVFYLKHISDTAPNSHLTDRLSTIVNWSGSQPPQLVTNPIMSQQVFDHVKWLNELVYNETGVSQMSATSQKPQGIEAAAALQTMLDIETQRFVLLQKAYEHCVVKACKMTIAIAAHHYRGGESEYKVLADNGRFVDSINWSDVYLKSDEYILKVWPVNMLPQSPAGRMDKVMQMLQSGLVDPQTAMMLLDFPDVEAHQSLALAATKKALWYVDQLIYEGKEVYPKAWDDIGRCIKFMQMGLTNAEMEGAPEEVFERGLDFIMAAEQMLTPPQPPMAIDGFGQNPMPPMPMEGMPPEGGPMGGDPMGGGIPTGGAV